MTAPVTFDHDRESRIGIPESVFCEGKSADQVGTLLNLARKAGRPLLLTRLDGTTLATLDPDMAAGLDYDTESRTAILGRLGRLRAGTRVAIVTAGTSDEPVAREAERTLRYLGHRAHRVSDAGVAGLWRILEHRQAIDQFPVVIVVAGMDGALVSVVGGLVGGAVIAVPTSTGYGAAEGGRTALMSALTSCAPGVLVCNIDNGYGAACAAHRVLGAGTRRGRAAAAS